MKRWFAALSLVLCWAVFFWGTTVIERDESLQKVVISGDEEYVVRGELSDAICSGGKLVVEGGSVDSLFSQGCEVSVRDGEISSSFFLNSSVRGESARFEDSFFLSSDVELRGGVLNESAAIDSGLRVSDAEIESSATLGGDLTLSGRVHAKESALISNLRGKKWLEKEECFVFDLRTGKAPPPEEKKRWKGWQVPPENREPEEWKREVPEEHERKWEEFPFPGEKPWKEWHEWKHRWEKEWKFHRFFEHPSPHFYGWFFGPGVFLRSFSFLLMLHIVYFGLYCLLWWIEPVRKRLVSLHPRGWEDRGISFLVGLAVMVLVPIVSLVLVVSVVGILLLPVLYVGLWALAVVGGSLLAYEIGGIFRAGNNVYLRLFLGQLVVLVIKVVPGLGWFLGLIFLTYGLGAGLRAAAGK